MLHWLLIKICYMIAERYVCHFNEYVDQVNFKQKYESYVYVMEVA